MTEYFTQMIKEIVYSLDLIPMCLSAYLEFLRKNNMLQLLKNLKKIIEYVYINFAIKS